MNASVPAMRCACGIHGLRRPCARFPKSRRPTHSWKTARAAANVANHTLNSGCPLKNHTNGCSKVGSWTFAYTPSASATRPPMPEKMSIRRSRSGGVLPLAGRGGGSAVATAGAATVAGSATGWATVAAVDSGGANGGGGTLAPRGGGFGGVGREPGCCSSATALPSSPPTSSRARGVRSSGDASPRRPCGHRESRRGMTHGYPEINGRALRDRRRWPRGQPGRDLRRSPRG